MEWDAMARVDVVNVATPLPFNVPVPSVAAPSANVALPVGVPEVPDTVAVNVTDWPTSAGFSEEVIVVVDGLLPRMTCVMTLEVLATWSESPLYIAMIEWEPEASPDVAKLAVPFPFSVDVPNDVLPL